MKTSPTALRIRVLLLVLLGCWGFAAMDRSADEALSRRTAAGREVLVRGFAEFDAQCRLRHVQTVKVVDTPSNGRIEQRPGVVTIGENGAGDKSCAGTELDGIQVFYVPNDGFTGSDHFAIDVVDARHRTVRAKVDVAVDGMATAKNP